MIPTNTSMEPKKPRGIYKEASDRLRAAAVAQDLGEKISILQGVESRGRVDLHDTEAVREVAQSYLRRCQDTGSIPTVMSLAANLGVSRQWLNRFVSENPTHPTTQYIEILKELFADCLTQAGFGRYVSESLTIFILKNCAAMSDRVEIEATANTAPLGESISQQALEERIAGSVVVDDDDY